jgi:hypothetical protein
VDPDTKRATHYDPSYISTAFNGALLCGSVTTNDLYILSDDVFTYNGVAILRNFVAPIVWQDSNPVTMREVMLDISMGLTQDLSENPVVMGKFSRDGGFTWGTETWRSIGRTGQYGRRPPIWVSVGMGRGIVPWFTITANQEFTIRGVRVTIEKGGFR